MQQPKQQQEHGGRTVHLEIDTQKKLKKKHTLLLDVRLLVPTACNTSAALLHNGTVFRYASISKLYGKDLTSAATRRLTSKLVQ